MQIPVEITFKDMERSAAVETRIRELADKLERVYDRVVRCDVMVETPHRHQNKGRQFHVRVRLTVPGGEVVASHDPGPDPHEDVYIAIRDAFAAARRQLEDHARKSLKRGEGAPKMRNGSQHGRVTFLDVEKEWGWIEPDDGRRIYFHRNSVLDGGMQRLEVGDEVRFTEEAGNEGPQASTVDRIGNHGHHDMPQRAAQPMPKAV